jgi:hypothetical protein
MHQDLREATEGAAHPTKVSRSLQRAGWLPPGTPAASRFAQIARLNDAA